MLVICSDAFNNELKRDAEAFVWNWQWPEWMIPEAIIFQQLLRFNSLKPAAFAISSASSASSV